MHIAVTAEEMVRLERLAVQDGCSEEAFMEEAGRKVALFLMEAVQKDEPILLLVGKGNKGGDAYAAASFLLERQFSVHALALYPPKECSPLNQKMHSRFQDLGGSFCSPDVDFSLYTLIVDGLLGTGFHGKLTSPLKELIQRANASSLPICAIDIPSGLNGTTGEGAIDAIQASVTISLGCAKSGFFLQNGWNCVGELLIEDFGLPAKYVKQANVFAHLPHLSTLSWPPIVRNRHKYQTGYVLGYGGSKTYSGAPKLSSLAAFRAGAGIVRLFYPDDAAPNMANTFPEVIHSSWDETAWQEEVQKASSLFIGPGLGKKVDINKWGSKYLRGVHLPCVIDADALRIEKAYWPKKSVLTPHRGEAKRLLHITSDEQLFPKCQQLCDETGAVLVLKGAPTFIFFAGKSPTVIPHGDPGMATAGTGDVLTGIIAALLAQGLPCEGAAILGTLLHAYAGEEAARRLGSRGMIASDLIEEMRSCIRNLSQCGSSALYG